MYEGLKPCTHRTVDNNGRILCALIKGGDGEVSINLCRDCPVPQINCQHLRAAIHKRTATPITIRYATGRTEIWDDEPPKVEFKQAACAVKTMPIHSPRDCAGCLLKVEQVIPQSAVQVARRRTPQAVQAPVLAAAGESGTTRAQVNARSLSVPSQEPVRQSGAVGTKKRSEGSEQLAVQPVSGAGNRRESKSKIILMQHWLAEQFTKKTKEEAVEADSAVDSVEDIVLASSTPVYEEQPGYERCVGWTD